MNKLAAAALAMVMLGPILPLMAVGVLVNPATQACSIDSLAVGVVPDRLDAATADGVKVTLDHKQLTHAATIITVGARTPGVGRDGVIIALMAALTESRLRNLANTGAYPSTGQMPNDGDGADHDSLGLFQMRHASGWGTVEQLMDPTYQARAFYGGTTGPNRGNPRGLLDIPSWQKLSKGQAAQTVEASAYPDRYDTWTPVAQTIIDTLTAGGGDQMPASTSAVVFPLPAGSWVKASGYGWRIHPISHVRKFHAGTDYAAKAGTPIMAVADGIVTYAGTMGGYGHAIDIKHIIDGQQVTTRYGHMWAGHLYVKTGDRVTAGQHIADVGSDGMSTGPHLHFETRVAGATVDSDQWLKTNSAHNLDQPGTNQSGCYLGGNL